MRLASEIGAANTAAPPRLQVCALPSATAARFALLLVTALGTVLFLYAEAYTSLATRSGRLDQTTARCGLLAQATFPTDSLSSITYQVQCQLADQRDRLLWLAAGPLLLFVGAWVVYRLWPGWRIRWERLRPMAADDGGDAAASQRLASLVARCERAGLPRLPTLLERPRSRRNGSAFGCAGRYAIALDLGLLIKPGPDGAILNAVLDHELAHLQNNDVDKTYFAVALWWVALPVSLAPLAVILLAAPSRVIEIGWRAVALLVAVYLAHVAVLRSREHYADIRASADPAVREVLERLLLPTAALGDDAARRFGRLQATSAWVWLRSVLDGHPTRPARRELIASPHRIFGHGFWEACGVGVTAALGLMMLIATTYFLLVVVLAWLLGWLLAATSELGVIAFLLLIALITLGSLFLGVLFALLLVGWLIMRGTWTALWGGRVAAVVRGEAPPSTDRLGLGLGVGLVVGQHLGLTSVVASRSTIGLDGVGLFLFDLGWAAVLIASAWFLVRWLASVASAWAPLGALAPAQRLRWTVGGGGVLLSLWLSPICALWFMRFSGDVLPLDYFRQVFSGDPFILSLVRLIGLDLAADSAVIALIAVGLMAAYLTNPFTYAIPLGLWILPQTAWSRVKGGSGRLHSDLALDHVPDDVPLHWSSRATAAETFRSGLIASAGYVLIGLSCQLLVLFVMARHPAILIAWAIAALALVPVIALARRYLW